MGLFDSWRRKKQPQTAVKLQEPKKPIAPDVKTQEAVTLKEPTDINSLVAEYDRLILRREELQEERRELITKLDRGELNPDEFRGQLMNRIQEAARVSENLRTISIKLTSLGHRGVLH
jgi:hypothetical protein